MTTETKKRIESHKMPSAIGDAYENALVAVYDSGEFGREGLQDTPERVERSMRQLLSGYFKDPADVLQRVFESDNDSMVICKEIEFYSLCEHHLLPFFGRCHIGYIPKGKVLGLSKMPRLVDIFARRLQIQEQLTLQIAEAIMEGLDAAGVGVVMEAVHLCMRMRGVEKQASEMTTSAMLGNFKENIETRTEFLRLIERG